MRSGHEPPHTLLSYLMFHLRFICAHTEKWADTQKPMNAESVGGGGDSVYMSKQIMEEVGYVLSA